LCGVESKDTGKGLGAVGLRWWIWFGRVVCGDWKGEHGEAERRFGICGDGKRRQDDGEIDD
jgi:hypothetical protein